MSHTLHSRRVLGHRNVPTLVDATWTMAYHFEYCTHSREFQIWASHSTYTVNAVLLLNLIRCIHNECWAIGMSLTQYLPHESWLTAWSIAHYISNECCVVGMSTCTSVWVLLYRGLSPENTDTECWVTGVALTQYMHSVSWLTVSSLAQHIQNGSWVICMSFPQYTHCEYCITTVCFQSPCIMRIGLQAWPLHSAYTVNAGLLFWALPRPVTMRVG